MRVIDQLPQHSLLVVENDNGEFAVLNGTADNPRQVMQEHMSHAAAMSYWHKLCLSHFYQATHSISAAHALADRHMATIH